MYEFKYDVQNVEEESTNLWEDVIEEASEEIAEDGERSVEFVDSMDIDMVKDAGVIRGSGKQPWGYIEDTPEDVSTSIFGKIAFGVGILAIGTAAFFVFKNKKKIEEHQIKNLEKKGYIICKPEDVQKAENTLKEVDSRDRI